MVLNGRMANLYLVVATGLSIPLLAALSLSGAQAADAAKAGSKAIPAGSGSVKGTEGLQAGLAAFNSKKFAQAAEHFQTYLKGRTPDSRTTYYLALCYMQTGQSARAKQFFEYIVKNFPQSQEFALSQKALSRWGGSAGSASASVGMPPAGVASGGDADEEDSKNPAYQKEFAGLPDQAEFRYQVGPNGHMEVDAWVNGRPITCWFDTGASAFFGINHLGQLGIRPPSGKPDGFTSGWASTPVPVWHTTTTVKIGNMTRTLPLTVAEHWDNPPLIGQDFAKGFQYAIDSGGKRVTLTKKIAGGTAQTNSLYDVPCVVKQEREFVTLNVGGKSCSGVLIDTGAAMTIISLEQAASMNLDIPDDAPVMMAGGVGGMIPFRRVGLDLRLGPIVRQDFPVMIGGHAGSAIGQDFMSGWRFTVDRDRGLLRFFH